MILEVVSVITPPWLASVVMDFDRGHEGRCERFEV